jgi:tRNA(fMet)-specific endonuclease VapC
VKYVLDTNAFSALMQGRTETIDRLAAVARENVSVPQPVLSEIAYGLERLPQSRRRKALQERFDLLRGQLARCPWTDEVSEAFVRIKAALEKRGQRIEDFDAAIAAHAAATGATLVTANARQMTRVPGLLTEDWTRPTRRT